MEKGFKMHSFFTEFMQPHQVFSDVDIQTTNISSSHRLLHMKTGYNSLCTMFYGHYTGQPVSDSTPS